MKRVLVIAYYWPPSGGSGVQRWVKFVKYLPSEGWEPVVFAPRGADYPIRDTSLNAEVPASVEVLRGGAVFGSPMRHTASSWVARMPVPR